MAETKDESLQEEVLTEEEPTGEVVPLELTVDEKIALMQLQFEDKREADKRHFQSVADQQVRRAEQQATQNRQLAEDAQRQVAFLQQQGELSGLDPEEQRIKKAELAAQQAVAEVQRMRQERALAAEPIYKRMPPEAKALVLGARVKLADSRIDWALDETDYDSAMERIQTSLDKIKVEEATKKEAQATEALEEAKERLRAEQGNVETVPVETSGRAASSRRFEDIEQAYSEGKISSADYAQARKEAGID